MEDFALFIIVVAVVVWIFDDEIFKKYKNDRTRKSKVHKAEPDETKSGKPQKEKR